MNLFEKRRSIRRYKERTVDKETVIGLLSDAVQAPSAGNQQPWRFVVVTERETLDALSSFSPYAGMLRSAPLAIVVVADHEGLKYPEMWQQDCAACTENLLLSAADRGLGGVWLGVAPHADRMENIREILGIPENMSPFAVLSLGYPAEDKKTPERYKQGAVHWEQW